MELFQTSPKTLSRLVNDELIVIQLDTGRYHYFSKGTEKLLEFFASPASVDDLVSHLPSPEQDHLRELCAVLEERKILEPALRSDRKTAKRYQNTRPSFLRDGEKTLEQISFASP